MSFYCRQISTYGEHTMKSIQSLSIYIPRITPVIVEMIKNLVLSGTGKLWIEQKMDFFSPMYMNQSNIFQWCFYLNPNVKCMEGKGYDQHVDEYDILVIDEPDKNGSWAMYDSFCEKHEKWLLICHSFNENHSLLLWQNIGKMQHVIHDVNGEKRKQYYCITASCDSKEITVDTSSFDFHVGDRIELVQNSLRGTCVIGIRNNTLILEDSGIIQDGNYFQRSYYTETIQRLSYSSENIYHHIGLEENDHISPSPVSKHMQWYPLVSMMGGILAQECLKFTGKYTPLLGLTRIHYPLDTMSDWQNKKIFIVGSGALGCEALKNIAMMGNVCTGEKGMIYITDMDRIELSNLSRQFLFQQEDIGKWKSEVAAHKSLHINPHLRVTAYTLPVGLQNTTTFNETFWSSLDVVINALDNVEARKFVDDQCRWYQIPLYESGTLGTKANFQYILPFETETYNDSVDPTDNDEIPVCTIKSYPYKIDHCIQWAKELLHYLLCELPNKMESKEVERTPLEQTLYNHMGDFALWSTECILHYFIHEIEHIRKNHPMEDQEFWSGVRKYPSVLFQASDPLIQELMQETFYLLQSNDREVDKDKEEHVSWIFKSTQVRAATYMIPMVSYHECKTIAGNIIPAICTTTSIIMGRVCHSIFTPSWKKNCFFNLATNLYLETDVVPPILYKSHFNDILQTNIVVLPHPFSCWDRISIAQEANVKTIQHLKTYIETQYQVNITSILYVQNQICYHEFMNIQEKTKALSREVEYKHYQVEAENAQGDLVQFPLFTLI